MTDKAPAEAAEKIYASMDDILSSGVSEAEYAVIDGFKPGEKVRIGSVTAGDIALWSEASEGEAKKTAGMRLIIKSLVGPPPSNIRYADKPENIEKLKGMRQKEFFRIVNEILKLNGLNAKAQEDAKKD